MKIKGYFTFFFLNFFISTISSKFNDNILNRWIEAKDDSKEKVEKEFFIKTGIPVKYCHLLSIVFSQGIRDILSSLDPSIKDIIKNHGIAKGHTKIQEGCRICGERKKLEQKKESIKKRFRDIEKSFVEFINESRTLFKTKDSKSPEWLKLAHKRAFDFLKIYNQTLGFSIANGLKLDKNLNGFDFSWTNVSGVIKEKTIAAFPKTITRLKKDTPNSGNSLKSSEDLKTLDKKKVDRTSPEALSKTKVVLIKPADQASVEPSKIAYRRSPFTEIMANFRAKNSLDFSVGLDLLKKEILTNFNQYKLGKKAPEKKVADNDADNDPFKSGFDKKPLLAL